MKCYTGYGRKCEAVAARSAGCHARRQLVVRGANAQNEVSRRGLVEFTAGLGLALSAAPPALAKVPKGFQAVRDTGDGYEFLFPFGWQEVSVSGIDTVYKDVIEPLESVSVQLTPTDKASITEYGPVNEVAGTLAGSVLARSTDEVQLIKSTQEEADGRDYFAFEFLQKSARFTRHVVAVATVANGKLILFTTGAKEARWGKMKDKLTKSVESFKAFNVYK